MYELCSTKILEEGLADPQEIFERVNDVLDAVLSSLRARGVRRIKGIGFASFVMNIFGVDTSGTPVTPCYSYAGHQVEHRPTEELLKKNWTREDHIRTGAVIHASYATVQLRTLAESNITFPTLHRWQTLASYICAQWTGQAYCPVSFSEASWTGLLNHQTCEWDEKAVHAARLSPQQLPPLADGFTSPINVGLSPTFSRRWPEMANTPLFLGLGDGVAATVSS